MSTADCPRCGWNRASTTNAIRVLSRAAHNPGVSTDELPLLEDQVRRIDEEISRLHEDRAAILRRINSTRSATRHLSPEVLTTIFKFVSPLFDFIPSFASGDLSMGDETYICKDLFQYNMAAVCHAWRQTAISTPQLWTSLSLTIHPCFIGSKLSLLSQFSQKALRFPMSIELNFEQQTMPWPEDHLDCLFLMQPIQNAVFVKHADRIQSLRLIEPPREWLSELENLSRCDTLEVVRRSQDEDEDEDDEPIDLTVLSYLRHVVLIRPGYTFLLPRSSITTLHFCEVSCITGMELLINCPNLVEFESYSSGFCSEEHAATTIMDRPITLEHIECLTWSNHRCRCLPFIRRCIGYLRFSKLRNLQWYGDSHCYSSAEGRDQRHDFFSNLPTTLSSLTFYRFIYPVKESSLKELLYSIPQLRELCLIDCDIKCVEAVINAIGRPFVPPSEKDQQQDASPELPSLPDHPFLLHLLKLSLASHSKRLDGQMLVDMLEAMQVSGKNLKHFQLELPSTVSWNIDSLSRLRALGAFGFSVEGV